MIDMINEKIINLTYNDENIKVPCKYCGKKFRKNHNREMYCSERCRQNARREQKAKYQAKRRLLIKRNILIIDEYKKYGLGSYGTSKDGHRKSNFSQEYRAIQKEMKRIGLK